MALRHCQPLDEPTVLVARPDTRRARRGQAVPDRADPSSHRGRRAGRFNRRSLRLPRRELQPPGAGRTTDVDAHGAPAAAQSGMGRRRWFGDCARCAGAPGEFRQPIALADLAGRGPEARSLRPDRLPYACAAVGSGRRRAARQPCTPRSGRGAAGAAVLLGETCGRQCGVAGGGAHARLQLHHARRAGLDQSPFGPGRHRTGRNDVMRRQVFGALRNAALLQLACRAGKTVGIDNCHEHTEKVQLVHVVPRSLRWTGVPQ